MVQISTRLVEVDHVCDYIPIVSTISNLVNLFEKAVAVSPFESEEQKGHYWSHIEAKSLARCFFLLIPLVSNIYYFVKEFKAYREEVKQYQEVKQDAENKMTEDLIKSMKELKGITVTRDDVKPSPNKKERLLFDYCFKGELEKAEQLLSQGVKHTFYHLGSTPLIAACMSKNKDLVQLLLEKGAQADLRDKIGNSALEAACQSGNLEIVKMLLDRKSDKNALDNLGQTVLFYALFSKNLELIKFLKDQGIPLTTRSVNGFDALTAAIAIKAPLEIIEALLHPDCTNLYTIKYGMQQIKDMNLLMLACFFKHEEAVKFLIKRFDLNEKDSTGHTALMYGADNAVIVETILNESTDPTMVDAINHSGQTALKIAALRNARKSMELLVNKGQSQPLTKEEFENLLNFCNTITAFHGLIDSIVNLKSLYTNDNLRKEGSPREGMEVLFGPIYEEDMVTIKDLQAFLHLPKAF